MVGYDVKDVFKTCTPDQVREIYIGIIEVLQQPTWTLEQVKDVIRRANPALSDKQDPRIRYMVERIARTEMNRILMYAKEQLALQDGELDKRYAWRGPLDTRTTPMCRFLQTGELRGMTDRDKPYDYEYLRPELPEWREDGWTLPELKEAVRQVYEVFHAHGLLDTEMPSEWSMHINCRHSFHPISVIPEGEVRPPVMDNWIQPENIPEPSTVSIDTEWMHEQYQTTPQPVVPMDTKPPWGEPMGVEMDGASVLSDMGGSEEVYVDDTHIPITFGVLYSVFGMPAYYLYEDDDSDDPVYVFDSLDENDIARYAGLLIAESELGTSEYDLAWYLRDEGLSDGDVNFLMEHTYQLYDVAQEKGWLYA